MDSTAPYGRIYRSDDLMYGGEWSRPSVVSHDVTAEWVQLTATTLA
jgi:hypothetical protein